MYGWNLNLSSNTLSLTSLVVSSCTSFYQNDENVNLGAKTSNFCWYCTYRVFSHAGSFHALVSSSRSNEGQIR